MAKKTKTQWKSQKVHKDVVLPSGAKVDIRLPNLAKLATAGQIPNALLAVAIKPQKGNQPTEINEEVLKENWEFTKYIVPWMVVEPAITPEDLEGEDSVPDMDAAHQHIGGLQTYQSFRDARGIFTSDPDLLGDEGGESLTA
jgi:hypothetical protein